jgi:hypothetical protein
LSLGHLDQLMYEGALTGPAGGLRISYRSLHRHYLRGEGIAELVRSGYIGTRGATTDHLQVLIEASLGGGKAVVAAIQTAFEPAVVCRKHGSASLACAVARRHQEGWKNQPFGRRCRSRKSRLLERKGPGWTGWLTAKATGTVQFVVRAPIPGMARMSGLFRTCRRKGRRS